MGHYGGSFYVEIASIPQSIEEHLVSSSRVLIAQIEENVALISFYVIPFFPVSRLKERPL